MSNVVSQHLDDGIGGAKLGYVGHEAGDQAGRVRYGETDAVQILLYGDSRDRARIGRCDDCSPSRELDQRKLVARLLRVGYDPHHTGQRTGIP